MVLRTIRGTHSNLLDRQVLPGPVNEIPSKLFVHKEVKCILYDAEYEIKYSLYLREFRRNFVRDGIWNTRFFYL